MKKYQLPEDMAQYRKYWMTKIMADPAQGDARDRWEGEDRRRRRRSFTHPTTISSPYLMGGHFSGLMFSLLPLVISTGLLCSLLPLPSPTALPLLPLPLLLSPPPLPFPLLLSPPLIRLSLARLLASFGVCFSSRTFCMSPPGHSSL